MNEILAYAIILFVVIFTSFKYALTPKRFVDKYITNGMKYCSKGLTNNAFLCYMLAEKASLEADGYRRADINLHIMELYNTKLEQSRHE